MRMKCLFAVQDDLHDYTEAVRARLQEHASAAVALSELASDNFECRVVHRQGRMQSEVIRIFPNTTVPQHVHPHVDSIDLIVSGDIDLVISGKRIAEGYAKDRRETFFKRAALRIAACAPHGGSTGADGVLYISCQKWSVEQSHIALAWAGPPCTKAHERLLESLEGVR